jgi:hypothetical protein
MGSQINCPKCGTQISNLRVIDEAAAGNGSSMQVITCDCGERITYWQIAALLREQKKFSYKIKQWIKSFSGS